MAPFSKKKSNDPAHGVQASAAADGKVTYALVKPILDRNCVEGCHNPTSSLTRDFSTYRGSRLSGLAILNVSTRAVTSMPKDDRRLTQEEKDLLRKWGDDGFLE